VPELYFSMLDPGDLVILACDGIFDVMSNDELADMVLARIEDPNVDLGQVAADITRHCLLEDSKDNMTLLIAQVGVTEGTTVTTEEVQGLEKIATLEDESVKNLYVKFLEQHARGIPEAQAVLEQTAKLQAEAPQTLTTRERLQRKMETKANSLPTEGRATREPITEQGVDLDALVAFVTGASTNLPMRAMKKKAPSQQACAL
jgi:hypothetical protein